MFDPTTAFHVKHASTGLGATKIAARMISAHKWKFQENRKAAMDQLAVLGGRTMASWEAGKENGNG